MTTLEEYARELRDHNRELKKLAEANLRAQRELEAWLLEPRFLDEEDTIATIIEMLRS